MINYLKLKNVGIKEELELNIAPRLNVLTGDNGLGKSFVLDILFWALSGEFPQRVNGNIRSGYIAKPLEIKKLASITIHDIKEVKETFFYEPSYEEWFRKHGVMKIKAPEYSLSDIVIYSLADGSFALWDKFRNKPLQRNGTIDRDGYTIRNNRALPYAYTQEQLWDGINNKETNQFFNGMLQDWQMWQLGNTKEFNQLKSVLLALSEENEPLEIGELRLFTLSDTRKYPTIKSHSKEVLLPHCSSAIRRIVTLAYFLVLSWNKHCEMAEFLGEEPAKELTLLIDEVEAHLHPKWQRKIVPALMKVMKELSSEVEVQLVLATHSPLVMASLEPEFDSNKDKWIDFDLDETGEITVNEREFEKQGTVENWLASEAFNLTSSRAPEYEALIEKANAIMSGKAYTNEELSKLRKDLGKALEATDEFWLLWHIFCKKQNIL